MQIDFRLHQCTYVTQYSTNVFTQGNSKLALLLTSYGVFKELQGE